MFRLGRSGLVRQVQRAGSRQYSTRNASGNFNRNLLIAAAVVPVTVVYALFNKVHVQNLPIDNERIETLSHALKQVVAGDDEEEKANSKKNADLKQDKYNTSKENEDVLAKKAPTAQDPVAQRGQERDTTKEETTKENYPQISRKANKLEETKPESDSEEPAEKDERSDSDKTAELKKEKAEQSNSNKEKLDNAAPTAEDPVAQRSKSDQSSGSETKEHLPQTSKKADKLEETKPESEESGAGEAAYNPETGEINWDCPCLGGMAHGPCGEEFKEAFACFVYSDSEPKGIDCIKKFENMRSCFREHPEHYKEELYEDDQEESIVETKAAEAGAN